MTDDRHPGRYDYDRQVKAWGPPPIGGTIKPANCVYGPWNLNMEATKP